MKNGDLIYPEPGARTLAGDPVPVGVHFEPPQPEPGNIVEDSYARSLLGEGHGPRLPTATEWTRARYEQAMIDEEAGR